MVQIKKQKIGVIIGKFMPFHTGHKYLIDFGSEYVETLYVLVCTIKNEPINGKLRFSWIDEHYRGNKNIIVIHNDDENPQYPHEHENFWDIWKESILFRVPSTIDILFASESYGQQLSETIGAEFIPVDISRSIVSISATKIRENPYKNWDFLPLEVRKYYAKKICIFGPESCGKSILTHLLAEYYDGSTVDEYARGYLASKNNECTYKDIDIIARGHIASEKAAENLGEKYMFLDTDIITTCVWSDILFEKIPDWCIEYSHEKKYDHYLLLDIDTIFVEDEQRYLPEKRKWLFDRFETELQQRDLPYTIVSGLGEDRLRNAVKALETILD